MISILVVRTGNFRAYTDECDVEFLAVVCQAWVVWQATEGRDAGENRVGLNIVVSYLMSLREVICLEVILEFRHHRGSYCTTVPDEVQTWAFAHDYHDQQLPPPQQEQNPEL